MPDCRLTNGVPQCRQWPFFHLVHPSAGESHSSEDLVKMEMSALTEVEVRGPEGICFTWWASRWPLDRLGREWASNQIIQGYFYTWPPACSGKGINLGGGTKVMPYPEQAGILTKFLTHDEVVPRGPNIKYYLILSYP